MNATEIFGLISQGLTLLPLAIQAGEDIGSRIEQLVTLAEGGQNGTLTADQIAATRTQFDTDLATFNTPIQ